MCLFVYLHSYACTYTCVYVFTHVRNMCLFLCVFTYKYKERCWRGEELSRRRTSAAAPIDAPRIANAIPKLPAKRCACTCENGLHSTCHFLCTCIAQVAHVFGIRYGEGPRPYFPAGKMKGPRPYFPAECARARAAVNACEWCRMFVRTRVCSERQQCAICLHVDMYVCT